MDFRHPDGKQISVLLPRRSLMVMRGESRYIWSHGITPRKSDIVPAQTVNSPSDGSDCSVSVGGLTLQARNRRVSYTCRKVVMDRQAAKDVIFDATGMTGQIPDDAIVPRTDEEAVALERKHVNKVCIFTIDLRLPYPLSSLENRTTYNSGIFERKKYVAAQ